MGEVSAYIFNKLLYYFGGSNGLSIDCYLLACQPIITPLW